MPAPPFSWFYELTIFSGLLWVFARRFDRANFSASRNNCERLHSENDSHSVYITYGNTTFTSLHVGKIGTLQSG